MIFTVEKIRDTLDESQELLHLHWEEVAHYKDIPLDVDKDIFFKLEDMGMLRTYIAREGGKMIGYALFLVKPHPHYKKTLCAGQDVIFIHPDHRGNGLKFIKWCDEQLKAEGVAIVTHHIKFAHDWSKALERIGYERQDIIMSKRLQ
jgi:hypothetical protein